MSRAISVEQGQAILTAEFAPWVQQLGLVVLGCDGHGAQLRLPFDAGLAGADGVLSVQALMAAADTAMVIAIASSLGGYRPTAAVSQNISFMHAVAGTDVLLAARVLRPGKPLVFGEIEMRAAGENRVAAHATATYALLG
jgi:acyl-coenzyme A thioesterase PaaI-like protein